MSSQRVQLLSWLAHVVKSPACEQRAMDLTCIVGELLHGSGIASKVLQ